MSVMPNLFAFDSVAICPPRQFESDLEIVNTGAVTGPGRSEAFAMVLPDSTRFLNALKASTGLFL